MNLIKLTERQVFQIHEHVINPNELQGLVADKSLGGAIGRIDNRVHYGVIKDAFELAATYAVVLATGHVFNDANKRTAFRAMNVCLRQHNSRLTFGVKVMGDIIRQVAQGKIDEAQLTAILRSMVEGD